MRIGVTTRIVTAQGFEDRDALAQAWGTFLAAALPEALWMPIPNLGAERIIEYCVGWGIDRLILSGGDDIGATPLRDATEARLLAWAEALSIPLLGICRGMQVMACRAGVDLISMPGHVATRHALQGEYSGIVNSFHGLALSGCPQDYRLLARAPDGCIEAMRHRALPWEGWMWHPEREVPHNSADIERLRILFE